MDSKNATKFLTFGADVLEHRQLRFYVVLDDLEQD